MDFVLKNFHKGEKKNFKPSEELAHSICWKYVEHLLLKDEFEQAAYILWGGDQFTAEPLSVRLIWGKLPSSTKLLVIGASSMGKSYTTGVYFLLDWSRDCYYTTIKVVSMTQKHAKTNIFAHIKSLHQQSDIKMPGTWKAETLQANQDDKYGIHLVAIPQGDNGEGRLKGFHPAPRKEVHPIYGKMSRIMILLDEGEDIPSGVWTGVQNALGNQNAEKSIRVVAATNPRQKGSHFGQRCEPEAGFSSLDIESSYEWRSAMGWDVVRLDAAKSENVIQKREVYPGLQTWEGFQDYVAMGLDNPNYYTLARGWWPEGEVSFQVTSDDVFEQSIGRLNFQGKTMRVFSADLAMEGVDKIVASVLKIGKAVGFDKPDGQRVVFSEIKWAIQLERQFTLEKGDTMAVAKNIKSVCDNLGITARFVAVDRTGNGTGVHDYLRGIMGQEVMGIHYGSKATDKRVFTDDSRIAHDVYYGLASEMIFSVKRYMEFDLLKLDPMMDLKQLRLQITQRKFHQAKELLQVQSKDSFKSESGLKSPDEHDSLAMGVHLVRISSEFLASMLENAPKEEVSLATGHVDELNYLDFSDES